MIDKMYEILENNKYLKTVTKYQSPTRTIKLTRHRRRTTSDFILTVGRPNYKDRAFIKLCVKAKEPFPIKKFRIQYEAHFAAKGEVHAYI